MRSTLETSVSLLTHDDPAPSIRLPSGPVAPAGAVLIEDVTKPAPGPGVLKKGFLVSSSRPLYPPEGSPEGVLPEGAGDPLGYIPKTLREKCKVRNYTRNECSFEDYRHTDCT